MNAGFSSLSMLKSLVFPSEYEDKTEFDEKLRHIGLGVASQFETRANRRFSRVVDRAEKKAVTGMVLQVDHFPIESVSQVTFLLAGEAADNADVLTPDRISEETGIIHIDCFARQRDTVTVTYTGGYWWDTSEENDTSIPTGATPIPDDLFDAWITQVQAVIEARNLFGGESGGENTKQNITTRDVRFSEMAAEVVGQYARM